MTGAGRGVSRDRGKFFAVVVVLRNVAIMSAILLAVALVAISVFQERLLFLPPPAPLTQGRGATRVDFASSPDQSLFAFLIDPPAADSTRKRRFVVVFHGNGDLADSWIDWGQDVAARTGWSVFIPEYRGYGGLGGYPTAEGVLQDARAALHVLGSRYGAQPNEIVFHGHSLGSAIAAQIAGESGARALMLEAPMTSIVEVGQRNFGLPISWFLPLISRIHLAPIVHVPRVGAPVWVALGERDDVVPPSMARAVYAAAKRKGQLLAVSNAGHNDIGARGGASYRRWIEAALSQAAEPSSQR